MNSFGSIPLWTITAIMAGTPLITRAAEEPAPTAERRYVPWEKGSAQFGGLLTVFDSTLAFGINRASGVSFDAEELFGLDSTRVILRAEAMYRPGKSLRHQFDVSYGSYHRSGIVNLSEEIEINRVTYPVGARIESVFNFDLIRGTYSYALLQDDRMRIALGLGVYAVPLRYELDIRTTAGTTNVEGADITIPLPALALKGEFQLVPRLFLDAGINAMYLELSDFKGSLVEANVSLEYRPWKHFGLGVGYSGMAVSVEAETTDSDYLGADFVGNVDVRFNGLMLYGKVSF
jgi:hypothetical protein